MIDTSFRAMRGVDLTGQSSCFSSGSSSICGSSDSSVRQCMRSRRNAGSRSRFMCSSPSLKKLSPITSGIYIGATVHEVAQVAAAASSISAEAANTAVITKMVRVMMLGPFLLILSVYLSAITMGVTTWLG